MVQQKWKGLSIFDSKPDITEVKSALIPSFAHKDVHGKKFVGGVYDSDNLPVAASFQACASGASQFNPTTYQSSSALTK